MKRKNRLYYNLVEITLAMAVVGIGIAGIMALFVPALEASKEAIAEDYSSQVAGMLLAYIERQKKANWDGGFPPSAKPVFPDPLSYDSNGLPDTSSWDSDSEKKVSSQLYNLGGGVFCLKIGNGSQFCAFARAWADNIAVKDSKGTTIINDDGNFVKITVEIQWPATVPEAGRQKRYYILELGKPQ